MTVSTSLSRDQYGTNGTTGPWTVSFRFLADSDLSVIYTDSDGNETTLVLNTDFTVVGAGDPSGGTVTTTTAYASGGYITILRDMEFTQEVDYTETDGFPAETHEEALDRGVMQTQQLKEVTDRALVFSPSDTEGSTLPAAALRANKMLGFDSLGRVNLSTPASGSSAALALDLADSTTALKGDAMIGVGAVSAVVSGALTRYASINAAISAIGATVCTVIVRGATTLTGSVAVPATMALWVQNAAQIALAGYTLTINGPFPDPGMVKCFSGSGTVIFGVGSTPYVRPEWWGAKADAATNGTSGTDSTTALQAALNVPTVPCVLGFGNYLFTNLTHPAEKALIGVSIHASSLICKSGSTGTMYTDQGSAAKITIKGVAFYGNNCSYSQGLYLGHGATQFGTEGDLEVWVRDLPSGFAGIDVNGNVGHASRILSQDTGGVNLTGAAWMVDKIQAYGSKGFTVSGSSVGCNLQLAGIGSLEIEAPASGITPLYLTGNASIGYMFMALANGVTHPQLIEIGASCSTWNLSISLGFGSGAAPTITNGNIKSGTRYFGGNATGKSYNGEGFYTSENYGQREHNFTLRIVNTGGTIQHRISTTGGVASNSASAITAASATLQNTPTGADAATAMAYGGKIGSASPSVFWFDTRDQSDAFLQMNCGPVYTDNGTAYTAIGVVQSITINSVARVLYGVQFVNAATGAAFTLTGLGVGKVVQVTCSGYMAV